MITYIGDQLGNFLETDFQGDGAVLVDYVRVKLLYEKLRNFCTTCGLLSHDASECPSNNGQDNDDPANDDDGNDDAPDVPGDDDEPENKDGAMENQATIGPHEEEAQQPSKKRKTESGQLSEPASFPLLCCEMRQAYATEDEQQCMSKRNRRESEV
ncbi:unnamed protein product, partial [Arabidopsis halleri]